METVIGWLFGQGAEAAKEIGLAWLIRNTLLNILSGTDVSFDRFVVLGGIVLAVGLVALHIWRGDSWAGKFKVNSLAGAGLMFLACFLVVYGAVDLTVTRVLAARTAVHQTGAAQAPALVRHAAIKAMLAAPKLPSIPDSP